MINAYFPARSVAVHREETLDRASRWLIVAVVASGAFWLAIGLILVAVIRSG
jgi:ABC-type dipeptide/oligopeptide/nickel transport system permease component